MERAEPSAYWAGYWHAMADLEFGPCLIPGCPSSQVATADVVNVSRRVSLVDCHPLDERFERPEL